MAAPDVGRDQARGYRSRRKPTDTIEAALQGERAYSGQDPRICRPRRDIHDPKDGCGHRPSTIWLPAQTFCSTAIMRSSVLAFDLNGPDHDRVVCLAISLLRKFLPERTLLARVARDQWL